MQTAVIDASMVQLAIFTTKMRTNVRWCVMSARVHTSACKRHLSPPYRLPQKSVAGPMTRGDLRNVVSRVRSQGRREVLATWGVGIRAIEAETANYCLEA